MTLGRNYFGMDSPGQEVARPSSRDLPHPRTETCVPCVSAGADRSLPPEPPAQLVFHDDDNHGLTRPLCWSARSFSKVPAGFLLTHTVPLPLRTTSLLPNCLFKSCPSLVAQLLHLYQEAFQTPTRAVSLFLTSVHYSLFRCRMPFSRDNSLPP